MKAVGSYIIIEVCKESSKKTKGGLILTEDNREDIRYRKSKVISVGSLVKGVKKGNDIYYDKVAGDKIELKDDVYEVIKESDVVIVL